MTAPAPINIRAHVHAGPLVRQRYSQTSSAMVDYLSGVTFRVHPATEFEPPRLEEIGTVTSPVVAIVGPDLVRTRGGTIYRLVNGSVADLHHVTEDDR